jgi:Fic family protein
MTAKSALLERIDRKKRKLLDIKNPGSHKTAGIEKEIEMHYIFNSASLGGNTLSVKDVRLVLEKGLTAKGRTISEHLDVIRQRDALHFIKNQKGGRITADDILNIHRIAAESLSGRQMASSSQTARAAEKLAAEINRKAKKHHPVETAAFACCQLLKKRPFASGNGRVARLLSNLILLKNQYPLAIFLYKERKKYRDSLEKANAGNPGPFTDLLARAVERSLDIYLTALLPPTKETELLPLSRISRETPYSAEYLGLLARKGRLPCTKSLDNIWYTSRREVKKYIKSVKGKKNIG